jgi:uncharacterized protein YggT (Ycf19 family)
MRSLFRVEQTEFLSWLSVGVYIFVALMWVVPDRYIERILAGRKHKALAV